MVSRLIGPDLQGSVSSDWRDLGLRLATSEDRSMNRFHDQDSAARRLPVKGLLQACHEKT